MDAPFVQPTGPSDQWENKEKNIIGHRKKGEEIFGSREIITSKIFVIRVGDNTRASSNLSDDAVLDSGFVSRWKVTAYFSENLPSNFLWRSVYAELNHPGSDGKSARPMQRRIGAVNIIRIIMIKEEKKCNYQRLRVCLKDLYKPSMQ